jgi:predicted nucleotidyltransferase
METKKRQRKDGRPDKKVLDEIVQSVVEAAQPDKIILFGSAARGEMGPNSDIDLLIIKSGKFNHDRVTRDIYRNLSGAAAVDALVVTPEDLERYGDSPYLVYYPALREGRVVYDINDPHITTTSREHDTKSRKRPRKSGRPDKKVLDEIVQRVVEAAQPDKIILFGSAARGEMRPKSDIDLLVIKSGKFNYWKLLTAIDRHLSGDFPAVDVVLATPEDIQRYGDSPYLIYYPALREGKVIYGA